MKLNKLVKNINYIGQSDNRKILNICHDSRKVKKGTLFIAIAGDQNDGHDYIFDAIDKGAIAVLANGRSPATKIVPILQVKNPRKVMSKIAANFYDNPSKELSIIGITGTNGKTTTTQIIDQILKYCNKNSSSLGTLGFNSPTGIISTGFTTPESIDLQQIFRTLKDGGIDYVPMEVSSHAIDLHRIDNIDFNIGIFTNLSIDHLDYHGNMENYFNSKLNFLKKLSKKSTAILNKDDKYYNDIIKNINCKYLSYGFNNNCDLFISKYKMSLRGTSATIHYNNIEYKIDTNLIGKYNLYNLMAAILSCLKIGIEFKRIKDAIKNLHQIPGRLENFNLINDNQAIIDYAHTPDAYQNILENIKNISSKNKIITIFGCGGDRDKSKRPIMAKIVEKYSNFSYITDDNPRFENPDEIINDIIKGFKNKNYKIVRDRKKAILDAIQKNKNCTILIMGKGRENYQIIGKEKIPHSDIDIIREYINENKD